MQYQGKSVFVVRDARQGDPGFDASKDQIVIQNEDKNEDGTEMVVLRSNVTKT